MANHVRQQIRETAAATLTGLPTTGPRVYQSRLRVFSDADLPALRISTNDELVGASSVGFPTLLDRQINMVVQAIAKQNDNLDDVLDTMCKEVETALNATVAANTMGGIAKHTVLSSIEIDMSGEGDVAVGQANMNFTVTYKTRADAPDIAY
jgi:hypothetical protein